MRNIYKILILIIRNSSFFSSKYLREFRWLLYRKYYNASQIIVDEKVVIATAHANSNAKFICKGKVNIGAGVYIDYSGGVVLNDEIAISEGAKIYTHNHNVHDGSKNWKLNPIKFSSIIIENYVWIGADAIILPSVNKLGEGSIIGAGSVLTKDTEPYGIYGGNPAKKIGVRRIV